MNEQRFECNQSNYLILILPTWEIFTKLEKQSSLADLIDWLRKNEVYTDLFHYIDVLFHAYYTKYINSKSVIKYSFKANLYT